MRDARRRRACSRWCARRACAVPKSPKAADRQTGEATSNLHVLSVMTEEYDIFSFGRGDTRRFICYFCPAEHCPYYRYLFVLADRGLAGGRAVFGDDERGVCRTVAYPPRLNPRLVPILQTQTRKKGGRRQTNHYAQGHQRGGRQQCCG